MLKVEADNEKFGCWLETEDGSRIHLDTLAMSQAMFDLEQVWLGFFTYGFDGITQGPVQ